VHADALAGERDGEALDAGAVGQEPAGIDDERELQGAASRGSNAVRNSGGMRTGRRVARSTNAHSVLAAQTGVPSPARTMRVSRQLVERPMVRTQV
jgi:hypothetical protein